MEADKLAKIVERVRAREPGAMLELWEAVRRFVEVKARDYAHRCRIPFDDLRQDGFLAMLDAVELYDTGREQISFLSLLSFMLRKRFAEEIGGRSSKRDALQYADSIDGPAFPDEPDGPTVGESLPDDDAALAFSGVEYTDFLSYCRGMIGAALGTLTDTQAYLASGNAAQAAREAGYSERTARSAGQRMLTFVDVQEYLEQRNAEISEANTADIEEIRQFWTATMRGTGEKTGDRLKASELLAKTYGAFLDRVDVGAASSMREAMANLTEEELRALVRMCEEPDGEWG